MSKKNTKLILSIISALTIMLGVAFAYNETGKINKEEIYKAVNIVTEAIETYAMTDEEVKELPTTEIKEVTEQDEKQAGEEQGTTETEGFELQGEIAYNGDSEYPNISIGNYTGLTYYSQIDNRWKNHLYTSIGDTSQTIGTSGCGPTSAAMIVTATKGVIAPDTMGDLFVKYGYRSASNGTYYSAFRWVADTFNIGYTETTDIQKALQLIDRKNLVVVSCGNGLFTTGGHFVVIVGKDGDKLKIYDPYLYAGKFETATRRGKVTVNGNTVYCSVDNFINYANALKFFAFENNGPNQENNTKPVVTETYTRYVKANGGLRIRSTPNGTIVGLLQTGSKVTVYETSSNWSRIGTNQWVCSDYLYSTSQSSSTASQTVQKMNGYITGTYKVTASVLNVRTGPGTNYSAKTWRQLTANARSQNSRLGNYYTNGYKRGVVCTVTKVVGEWGLTASGYINLKYCTKL